MKIRNGFVSNSSSSSFIVRGVKLKIADVAKRLGVDPTQSDLFDAVSDKFGYGKGNVTCESTRYYFDNANNDCNTADVIIGVDFASLEDGVVCKLKDPDDTKIRPKIETKIGKVGKLNTYIQFIGNDNF